MKSIVWQQVGPEYISSVLGYRAIITERADGRFLVRIEDDNHAILWDVPMPHEDFEDAQQFVLFGAVDLEQLRDTDDAKRAMLETLDRCRSALDDDVHPVHLRRLELVRQWPWMSMSAVWVPRKAVIN